MALSSLAVLHRSVRSTVDHTSLQYLRRGTGSVMSEYYTDEEDFNIHVRRQGHSPDRFRYASRPQYLYPEQRTTVIARSRSRDRSRDARGGPAPLIINNNIEREHSDSSDDSRHRRRHSRSRRRRRSSSGSYRSRSRSRSRNRNGELVSRAEWEAEEARKQLEQLRLARERDEEERRLTRELREDAELRRTRRELDSVKRRESQAAMEKRIKEELELEHLQKEKKAKAEKERREKEAKEAVELYKLEESNRIALEKKRKEDAEKAYKTRLEDDLIKAGLDERYRKAILNDEPIVAPVRPGERPTYTRMLRKHLSIETLQAFHVEYDMDAVSSGFTNLC